jgi:class 3 adenylate cyclase
MGTRLPAAVVTVSLLALVVATLVAVITGRDLGQDINEEQLVALRASGAIDVSNHMGGLSRTAEALASSPQAVGAVEAFAGGHAELEELTSEQLGDRLDSVVTHHRAEYVEPLEEVGRDIGVRDIVGTNSAAIYLQHEYGVDLGPVENASTIDDAQDGSQWSEVHQAVHPVYRDVAARRDLIDLFLVEAESGHVVYSVNKRPELGTSLDVGPFSGSVLAQAVDLVREDPEAGVITTDLASYDPALTLPVGAVAAPVMDGERLVGILALMYDADPITDILTADEDWDDGGFPETGQSYLIGSDGTTRTEPRSYLEDPVDHLDRSEEIGLLTDEDRVAIEAGSTTVLVQPAVEETANAAEEQDTSVQTVTSMVGEDTFTAVAPLEVGGLGWSVVSEVDVATAEGGLDDFQRLLIVGAATFIVVLTFLAVGWAATIVRPIRAISDRLGSAATTGGGGTGPREPIEVPARSPIEFHRLAESFESMAAALTEHQMQLTAARTEHLRLLRRMLPPAVAERVAKGDLKSLEEVPQATVAAVVVLGLGELVRVGEASSERELVDRLHAELDDAAERHGLERVKVIGDAYFAACGHDRPLIDHAPRAVGFAADAIDAIREIGETSAAHLDGKVGVHTGPVTVGMSGGARLLYDVWGETVTAAHYLARQAPSGDIVVSDATRTLLPDSTEVTPVATETESGAWIVSLTSVGGPA